MRSLPRPLSTHPDGRPSGGLFAIFTLMRWYAARLVIRGADAFARP